MSSIIKNSIIAVATVCVALIIIVFTIHYTVPFTSLIIETTAVNNDGAFQLFIDTGKGFNEAESVRIQVAAHDGNIQYLQFRLPLVKNIKGLRIDPGNGPGTVSIQAIELKAFFITAYRWDAKSITNEFTPNGAVSDFTIQDGTLRIKADNADPFFTTNDMSPVYAAASRTLYIIKKIIQAAAVLIIILLGLIIAKIEKKFNIHQFFLTNIKGFLSFLNELYVKKGLIWDLTKNDLKIRFAGSHLGIVWAFVMPVVTILIFWIVFENGFKAPPVINYPFILWLSAGIIPWFFFQDCVSTATNSIIDYSFLVKKVVFRVSILPIVKILAALIIHVFFIAILILMNVLYGFFPTLYFIQIAYYLFAMIILLLGISWITSAAIVFFRDMGPFVNTMLQFLFWGTPIFWTFKIIPDKYQIIFKINPVFYLIQGYRDCFIDKVWFWERWEITLGYWCVTIVIFLFGAIFFMKLKPHFADVI